MIDVEHPAYAGTNVSVDVQFGFLKLYSKPLTIAKLILFVSQDSSEEIIVD